MNLFDPDLEARAETDRSGFTIGPVLTKKHRDGWHHPVEFLSS
jgi:hypothetical protein